MRNTLLKEGLEFKSVTGTSYTVDSFIAAGTQGEIYRITSEYGNKYALKIYYKQFASAQGFYDDVDWLVTHKKCPSPEFVWPKEVAVLGQTWGYIMNYVDLENKKSIFENDKLLERDLACKIAISIARAMSALHLSGLCYKDLSPNNFEYDENSGEVVIFDCDNIKPKGGKCTVSGTPGYRAPEIVLGKSYPDDRSDLYSMATIFFKMWLGADCAPLEGIRMRLFDGILDNGAKVEASEAEKYIYGSNALFVFHPTDSSNMLDPKDETTQSKKLLWQYFTPKELKILWTSAFTAGLATPALRPTSSRWRQAFENTLEGLTPCPSCGAMNTQSPICIQCFEKLQGEEL